MITVGKSGHFARDCKSKGKGKANKGDVVMTEQHGRDNQKEGGKEKEVINMITIRDQGNQEQMDVITVVNMDIMLEMQR